MQIQDKELLIIGLKDHIDELHTSPLGAQLCWWDHENHCYDSELLPGGDYELIGIWPDITEQQAQGLVEKANEQLLDISNCHWKDYSSNNWEDSKPTALESLATRMQKAGALTENLEGDEPDQMEVVIKVKTGCRPVCCGKPTRSGECCGYPEPEPFEEPYQGVDVSQKWISWQEAESRVFKKWGILRRKEGDNG